MDRLFDAKAFSKFSRYTADGKQAVGEIKRHFDGTPAENLIIKGNNLIALHSLAKQFKGKVKLIYIDPPYNTGEDSFKYNDKFSHSTWLTFMKNRLEIAKTLLADDGVILVQIDNSPSSLRESPEYGYLLVLMDEIFTRKNYVTTFTWKKKGNASNTKDGVGTITESILMYAKDFESITPNLQEFKRKYKYTDKNGREYNLENPVKTNEGTYKRETMVFPIITAEGTFYPPEGKRWTIGNNILDENGKIKPGVKYEIKGGIFYLKKYSQDYKLGDAKLYANLLLEHGSLKVAKDEIEKLGFNREDFDSPKPEKLIQALLEINTNENDIVLDYHLGSGTTAAVAHKMNRQYIGIEQMDYIETLAVERLKKVIKGEQGGISKAVNWQGGGEFIYAELAPFNETAKQQILACENSNDIKTLFNELYERYFLKYNVSVDEFSQMINEPEFQSLPLDEQKQMVLEMLDLNQMYVSLSEMDDEQFAGCLNDDDKTLSRAFYQPVKNQAEKKDGE
ncbi:site-specific DNA-methyltransferase [Haemophilus influenzae]|nr:site-specific DNA-methyltransferase [Haemophilus influenzae]UEB30780.1 site-specific DNA-methyltransferase [Haemophilus influenzae]